VEGLWSADEGVLAFEICIIPMSENILPPNTVRSNRSRDETGAPWVVLTLHLHCMHCATINVANIQVFNSERESSNPLDCFLDCCIPLRDLLFVEPFRVTKQATSFNFKPLHSDDCKSSTNARRAVAGITISLSKFRNLVPGFQGCSGIFQNLLLLLDFSP